jgi:ABC-2 type transport system permease protein
MVQRDPHNLSREERRGMIDKQPLTRVGQRPEFFRGTLFSYVDIWRHRELLGRLVGREVTARYKDSSLGIVWSLFRPLVLLLIYYFIIGQVLGTARSVPDFAVFVFIGITVWTLYSEILSRGTVSIMDNAGLVKKVYLPREVFPLSAVGSALVNFGIQSIVLIGGIAFFSHFAWSPTVLLAPLAILTILVFASALAMLLAAVNVYMRDTQHFVEIYVAVFFWVSPIVYPFTYVKKALGNSWMVEAYLANPVTISIIGAQKALWSAGSSATGQLGQIWPPDMELRLLFWLLVSALFFWFAQRVFSRLQGNFAQEI